VSAGETLPDVVLAAASAVGCPADVTQRSALTADELTGTPGGRPVTRVLDQAGYLEALRAKLVEEAEEAQAAPDRQLQSELADVLEVLRALAAAAPRDVACNANALQWSSCSRQSGKATGPPTTSPLTASTLDEVREAILERPYWTVPGRDGTTLVYGRTHAGRYLLVVAIAAGEEAFVITARDMTEAEKKTFRRKAR